ncbi:uncharacterized protein LOC135226980 [Macrobrachium nipponense]|uniref:uncharacterized protein LOC135226980 n=1 Tax=Macrobrachium nipponense TaxID=159736 RepID=UPI0030C7FFA4
MAVRLLKIGSRGIYSGVLQWKCIPLSNVLGADLSRRHLNVNAVMEDDSRDTRRKGLELFETLHGKGIDNRHRNSFLSLYQYLLDFGVDQKTLQSQFLGTPDLVKYPVSQWKNFCEVMVSGGMPADIAFKNIVYCPDILQINRKALEQHIEKLSLIYIGNHSLLDLVQSNPRVFAFPPKAIVGRLRKLSTMFVPGDLKVLVKNNPSIVTDKWDTVNEKILYIHEMMGLEQAQIAASEALQKSLFHIKVRHQFLYRAGLYKTPDLAKDKKSYKQNADLSLIMDTSNKFFVNKIARLTEPEYEVFYRMMKEEHDSISDDEDSDGSHSDEE